MVTRRRLGTFLTVFVYVFWGFAPLYWALLNHISPVEVILHRCIWSAIFAWIALFVTGEHRGLLAGCSAGSLFKVFVQAACLFANWLIFIYAISIGRTIDGALGYMINPLLSALAAMLIFREKTTKTERVALCIAGAGLLYFIVYASIFPYIGLSLALTFTCYSVLKKKQKLRPMQSLAMEMSVAGIFSLAYVVVLTTGGHATFGFDLANSVLLLGGGLITAFPFYLYGVAMQHIAFLRIAMLQYIAPSLMFLVGVTFLKEALEIRQIPGYALVWIALIVYTYALAKKEKIRGNYA